MKAAIFESALYIANLFFVTSDALALVVKDTEVSEEIKGRELIVLVMW